VIPVFALGLPLLLLLILSQFFFFVILSGSFITIFLELILWEQEVDLHDKISALKHILSIDANHLVERLGLVFVENVEKHPQFVLPFSRPVQNWLHVHIHRLKTSQEVLHVCADFAATEYVWTHFSVFLTSLMTLEQVNLKVEWTLLQGECLTEELGVILIVHPVV